MQKEYDEYTWEHFLDVVCDKSFWLYGAGKRGVRFVREELSQNDSLKLNGFIDKDPMINECENIPVYHLDFLEKLSREEIILISLANPGIVLSFLESKGFCNCFILTDNIKEFIKIPNAEDITFIGLYAPIGVKDVKLSNTVVTLLDKEPSVILSEFTKTNRYEIKRAESRDSYEMVHLQYPNKEDLKEFLVVFKEFMLQKQLDESTVDSFYSVNLEKRRNAGQLQISHVVACNKRIQIYHVYYLANEGRVRLACSASMFRDDLTNEMRALNGRLNRLLHWKDICEFKRQGLFIYDWGGINTTDVEVASVAEFKLGFSTLYEKRYDVIANNNMNCIREKCVNVICNKEYEEFAYDICNQLCDKYCVYLNGNVQHDLYYEIKLPDDILEKDILGYNPTHFFYSGYKLSEYSILDFTKIKSCNDREINSALNNSDVVIINISCEKDLLNLVNCMATDIIIVAVTIRKYINIVERILSISNLHLSVENGDEYMVSKAIDLKEKEYIDNRETRKQRAVLVADRFSLEKVISRFVQDNNL